MSNSTKTNCCTVKPSLKDSQKRSHGAKNLAKKYHKIFLPAKEIHAQPEGGKRFTLQKIASGPCPCTLKELCYGETGLKSLAKHFNFVVCNSCQSSSSLTILVPLFIIIIIIIITIITMMMMMMMVMMTMMMIILSQL